MGRMAWLRARRVTRTFVVPPQIIGTSSMDSGGAEFNQGGFKDCRRGVGSVRGFGERAMGILVGRSIFDAAEGDEGTLVVSREV